MTAYLTARPPVRRQWYAARNRPLTGCTVLHDAENIMDTLGVDTGAENVAEFIRTRTTPGSYHDLTDSDTGIHLVEYRHAAFHDGTGSNNWALSLSFACRTSDWARMSPAKRRGFLWQGAFRFVAQQQWRKANRAPLTRLRYITKAQSDAGESGFCCHGWRDPGRRTDPGTLEPHLFPFDEWLAVCAEMLALHMPDHPDARRAPAPAPTPAPTPAPEDDMPFTPQQIAQHASDGVANRVITEDAGKPVHTWEILRDLYHGQKAENAAMTALTRLVAEQNGLSLEDVRRVVSEEIAKGVDVNVTIAPAANEA